VHLLIDNLADWALHVSAKKGVKLRQLMATIRQLRLRRSLDQVAHPWKELEMSIKSLCTRSVSRWISSSSLNRAHSYATRYHFQYGSRAGVWRLLRLFEEFDIRCTVYANGQALEMNPQVASKFVQAKHEVASHGHRFVILEISYRSARVSRLTLRYG
jgi:hypothetical protein